ncbi:MAG: hypothetical protein HY906_07125 [Deltaproteobacteria bacterium]|nr:hypothetical protein [Deltaproteobacteria bacterium]
MRRLASCFLAALAGLALATCSPDTPTARFECACTAVNLASDNTRSYVLCESDGSQVRGDAEAQCELDFGTDAGCECTCDRNGDC